MTHTTHTTLCVRLFCLSASFVLLFLLFYFLFEAVAVAMLCAMPGNAHAEPICIVHGTIAARSHDAGLCFSVSARLQRTTLKITAELFAQILNDLLFKPRNIGLRDAEQIRNFLLCFFLRAIYTEAQFNNCLFPRAEMADGAMDELMIFVRFKAVIDRIAVLAEHIAQ